MSALNVVSGYAEVPGGKLFYEVAGTGPALVFVHGFSLDTRMWDGQFEEFSRRFTVVRYDVRGFGKSSLPTGVYSNARDLDLLLKHLNIKRAAVCGLSMGGTIAVEFAMLYPDRLWALVPVDTGGETLIAPGDAQGQAQWQAFSTSFQAIRRLAKSQGVDAARQVWLNHELFAAENESPKVKARLGEIVGDYSGWQWVNQAQYEPFKPGHAERYAAVKTPTLVVLGERDLLPFHAVARAMVTGIPGARMHVIPKAGHMSNMGAPAEFNRVVFDFLGGV